MHVNNWEQTDDFVLFNGHIEFSLELIKQLCVWLKYISRKRSIDLSLNKRTKTCGASQFDTLQRMCIK